MEFFFNSCYCTVVRKNSVILRSDLDDLGIYWEITSGVFVGLLKQAPFLLQNPVHLGPMSGDGI